MSRLVEHVCDGCGLVLRKGQGLTYYLTKTVPPEHAHLARAFFGKVPGCKEHNNPDGVKFLVEFDACAACEDRAEQWLDALHKAHDEHMALGLARVLGAGGATPEFFQVAAAVAVRCTQASTVLPVAAEVARAVK